MIGLKNLPIWPDASSGASSEGFVIARCPARYSCITVFQDYVFLIHFSRACCLGYAKIGTRLGMQAAADTHYRGWINT
ncbi:hypothetical protein DFP92_10242 [Yoonia sediminilitoris]|uniref:Uncharacterized protein n=1 Tax=Yoonia sediminilitoris TaxID=1286148 RepID=A0A2T6KLD9_9RHOB|nr:hypothetical protein C8N45_10242 [Yoonia sediminilitoris]RCW97327.1 hypothetical protein DFP92_10242 [Yoonia sediminilitoris]